MSVIRQLLNEVDVMKVEGDQGRPVYSLGALNVGQIRNTIGKLDEYWYLGQRMKPYLTFFFQSFRVCQTLFYFVLSQIYLLIHRIYPIFGMTTKI